MSWDDHETCRRCGARDCVGGLACLDRADAQRKAPTSQPTPATAPPTPLAYGSDNAGGVHLHIGDARVHLTHAEALDLARGLEHEAHLPPAPLKGIGR